MTFSYGTQWPIYAKQWDAMEALDDGWRATFEDLGVAILADKARYQGVELDTGVPWMMVAAIHQRESDRDFSTYLGNGEPLDQETTMVPAGRGPFDTWEEGAIDALTYDGLTEIPDWRLEKMLFHCEKYNGTGYHSKGLPSPYLWAGSTIQQPGKYVADGKFDPNEIDEQPGCCGILYAIHRLDPPAQYERETAVAPWV
jgi:lysozyme family protein